MQNVLKRLERELINPQVTTIFGYLEVEHLARTGLDHAPLFIIFGGQTSPIKKPFRFHNFQMEHKDFLSTKEQNWVADFEGHPYLVFKHKIKQVNKEINNWSKESYGDIFKQLISWEEIVKIKENIFKEHPLQITEWYYNKHKQN